MFAPCSNSRAVTVATMPRWSGQDRISTFSVGSPAVGHPPRYVGVPDGPSSCPRHVAPVVEGGGRAVRHGCTGGVFSTLDRRSGRAGPVDERPHRVGDELHGDRRQQQAGDAGEQHDAALPDDPRDADAEAQRQVDGQVDRDDAGGDGRGRRARRPAARTTIVATMAPGPASSGVPSGTRATLTSGTPDGSSCRSVSSSSATMSSSSPPAPCSAGMPMPEEVEDLLADDGEQADDEQRRPAPPGPRRARGSCWSAPVARGTAGCCPAGP